MGAARAWRGWLLGIKTQAEAAAMFGSNPRYVAAAVVVLMTEDVALLNSVLAGELPLLEAAKMARKRAGLVSAFRSASPQDRIAFAKVVGPDVVFDEVVCPAAV
jgi:hypothetical protein